MKLTAVAMAIMGAGFPMQAVGFLPTTPKISSQGFGAQLSSMLGSGSSDGTSESERNTPVSRARGARAIQMKSQATQVKTDVSPDGHSGALL